MSDDYLWDRSGEPDPEIARLENLLSTFRLLDPVRRPKTARRYVWFAAAASFATVAIGLAVWFYSGQPHTERTSWQAVSVAGSPRVNGRSVDAASDLFTGQRIETDVHSRVEVYSDFIGRVQLDPDSILYIKEASANHQLFSLRRGVMHALIWAPPSHFAVDTPAVRAIDLGCAYTLETRSNGDGLITVERGWVAFDHHRQESFIPAGAACRVNGKTGPGIPWFEDAPKDLQLALRRWEQAQAPDSLDSILNTARSRDALTLWHLLSRVPPSERGRIFDRFRQLAKVDSTIQRSAIIAGDPQALDRCWDALELGDTSWWRNWKRSW